MGEWTPFTKITAALEAAGVIFIYQNGRGAGVCRWKPPTNDPHQPARLYKEIHLVVVRSGIRQVSVCDCIDAVGRLAAWGGCGEPFSVMPRSTHL